jgi:hypothetical protein
MCRKIEDHAGVSALMEGIIVYIRHVGNLMLANVSHFKNTSRRG